ncbi:MaoC/PaaZ C-terminal domain-containing protein [Hoyosella sp. YIM 151337]|uniref:MaoC/PaaZ C-terminal domain-containing protein n=1 Tax=Hoyosella sp. YIM 151337 TaxID=2992742 RepID=UPI00223622C9|nr:MaoC/PaaZ C-terminal domain-containing protein [Hoyosella sp. YIM 151337]MCW4355701.1 MaoC/PaaZ C-terminal domain-containing protein [Hoyosella sp. YIM 151337]
MPEHELTGKTLGRRTVSYSERDVMLYALTIGAQADELDLIFEKQLQVLPTYALTLGLWAPDLLGELGAYDVSRAVHGSQELEIHAPLPVAGDLELDAAVAAVWDKGRAAVFDVDVRSQWFSARYSIFAPGAGGFGGPRGSAADRCGARVDGTATTVAVPTWPEQAALYRLTGDRHLIHILPDAAKTIGQPRPVMHGLCTLATSILGFSRSVGASAVDLTRLAARFSAPVLPGQVLEVAGHCQDGRASRYDLAVTADGVPVISDAYVEFASSASGRGPLP